MQQIIRILITGIGGGGIGRQVLKAIKLASTPYYIVGVDMSPISLGLFDVDEGFVVPPANDSNYIPTLINLCLEKKIQVLITGSEPELKVISEHREQFQTIGVLPLINPSEVISICMDKWRTAKFLQVNGFITPRSFLIKSEADVSQIDVLPVVIKPSVGGSGSSNVYIAQDEEELRFFCKSILKQNVSPLVQEYIGTPEDEYTVGVLTTLDGDLVNSIAIKRYILSGLSNKTKIRNLTEKKHLSNTLAISSGISQGIVDDYNEVREVCEQIAIKLGVKGPINIQCRYCDGKVYPFEINPRFSGTTSLRAMVGYNEPDILIRHHILGEQITQHFSYYKGYIMRGLSERYIPFGEEKKKYQI
jgi:carbamoyl-phosphate synthase large subunit